MPLLPLQSDLVYGPVNSRRLGRSLGVNPFPHGRKICNFNCAYCQYGWTREGEAAATPDQWPDPATVAGAVRAALRQIRDASAGIDRITLAGNGEPTLHPRFADLVEQLRALRDEEAPDVRLAILSNAGTLDRPGVAAALRRLDEAYLKLDTADSEIFRRLNGAPAGLPRILEGLRALPHVVVQSLFTRDETGRIDNTTPDAIERWVAALKVIAPLAVHVYSLDRSPAWNKLQVVPRDRLEQIAARARSEGLPVFVY